MKRAGFTMIELIFVIVILGILSAVALPKLLGVKEQAQEGLVKSFVGSLNRTVAPAKWSKSLMDGDDGSIATAAYKITDTDTDFPADFNATSGIDTTKCATSTATTVSAHAATSTDGKYGIVCRDGNASTAPRFWYTEKADGTAVTFDATKLKLD